MKGFAVRVLDTVADVEGPAWDRLVPEPKSPFLRHAWLLAMEASGSATRRTGWQPRHVTLWRGDALIAAAPAYAKFHSMGEYIYDFGWADAAARMGIEYYPKLLVGAPLSPSTTPKLLFAPDEDASALAPALRKALLELAREEGCSSIHVLYPPADEADAWEREGFARRLTLQFHWRNPGYRTYDDYLARFDSKRRHQLKRERRAAAEQGLTLRTVRGQELTPAHAQLASRFYAATCQRNSWGRAQLNRDFFLRAFATLPEAVELVIAERGSEVVAGAFNLTSGSTLYGRYWGCFEDHPFLHFNVCFYHSIDECIRLGRTLFEPGAGGEHKVARGFEPSGVHSAHLLFDRRLDKAVRAYVREEASEHARIIAESTRLAGMRPFVA
ncbi:MAG TPA: GNAT family N-acetyltransferase [Myxococcaceae bacterium]|nr:GNAT family N-acetyltransferase [Myxococcaceae bacterium]